MKFIINGEGERGGNQLAGNEHHKNHTRHRLVEERKKFKHDVSSEEYFEKVFLRSIFKVCPGKDEKTSVSITTSN